VAPGGHLDNQVAEHNGYLRCACGKSRLHNVMKSFIRSDI
jgi:hypothetical protein